MVVLAAAPSRVYATASALPAGFSRMSWVSRAAEVTGLPSTELITSPTLSRPSAGSPALTCCTVTLMGYPSSRRAAVSAELCEFLKSCWFSWSTCCWVWLGG
jgi:hypothetical protein